MQQWLQQGTCNNLLRQLAAAAATSWLHDSDELLGSKALDTKT
jgi:hypothetical protein